MNAVLIDAENGEEQMKEEHSKQHVYIYSHINFNNTL